LQDALQRARGITRRERVCAVVAAQHRHWWAPLLWALPKRNTIVQPENRGTGIGVLLALLQIELRDPGAQIILLPSDHHVADESVLLQSMQRASAYVALHKDQVVLLGLNPEEPDTELGHIVPAASGAEGVHRIDEFVEKPSASSVPDLLRRGALWNAFIVCGSVKALLSLYRHRCQEIMSLLRTSVREDVLHPSEDTQTARIYKLLPVVDFSRDVLRGQEAALRVLEVPACGWSDLGCVRSVAKVVSRGRRSPSTSLWTGLPPAVTLATQHFKTSEVRTLTVN
jgi:mannose-1-phosphate guanylyltransferase